MSVGTIRGGVPVVRRLSIDTTGREVSLPVWINHLKIRVAGACRMYFTQEDFTADTNYVLVPAPTASTPYGEWEGPVETAHNVGIWLKGDSATVAVELVVFQRRG